MSSKSVLLSLCVACVVAACKPGTPSRYIQPAEMEEILYDYHIGQAVAQLEDSSLEKRNFDRMVMLGAVLKKHGVTQAEFDSSLVYYYTRADRFQKMYRRVAERLSDEALRLGASEGEVERFSSFSQNGDTTDIWAGNRSVVLMPYAPYNRLSFSQKADSTFHKGDFFMLNLMVDFMYQTGTKDAVACLTVRLDNDSIISRVNHVTVSGVNQIRINLADSLAVKEIYGYFYLGKGSDQSSTLKLMFLQNIQLLRFHRQPLAPDLVKPKQTDALRPTPDEPLMRPKAGEPGRQQAPDGPVQEQTPGQSSPKTLPIRQIKPKQL